MKLQYIRLHTLTGKSETRDFMDHQLMPNANAKDRHGKLLWVGEAEALIKQWNKMGIVDGIQLWHYRLTVSIPDYIDITK